MEGNRIHSRWFKWRDFIDGSTYKIMFWLQRLNQGCETPRNWLQQDAIATPELREGNSVLVLEPSKGWSLPGRSCSHEGTQPLSRHRTEAGREWRKKQPDLTSPLPSSFLSVPPIGHRWPVTSEQVSPRDAVREDYPPRAQNTEGEEWIGGSWNWLGVMEKKQCRRKMTAFLLSLSPVINCRGSELNRPNVWILVLALTKSLSLNTLPDFSKLPNFSKLVSLSVK